MKLTSRVASFESRNRIRRLVGSAVGMLLIIATTQAARADIPYGNPGVINPITYTFTAASTGDVIAYYAIPSTTASFTETVGLLVNGVSTGITGLNNQTSMLGDFVDLGQAHAGDTLTFQLFVQDTGLTFSSNPSSNPDGVNHVYSTFFDGTNPGADTSALVAAGVPHGTYVAFEDVAAYAGSDFNYHDDAFVFSNTMTHATPEPSSALIVTLVGGLGGAGMILKRRRATVRRADA